MNQDSMSTTQIQPGNQNPSSAPSSRPDGGDLYDPRHWESAYREMHNAPALLIQLQDDLARSRQREAYWMSVVVHILAIIVLWNADKLVRYLPKGAVMVVAPDQQRQNQTTYLELPKDEQKVTKRPDTNKISDKDRIATAKRPQIDPKELKKIIDAARAGEPGPRGPALNRPPQPAQAPSQPMAEANPGPQQPPQPEPKPTPDQNQVAKITTPPVHKAEPSFKMPSMSAGERISEAARAAAANRGGYGGSEGDYGLGQGKAGTQTMGPATILSDTMGVDFAPYLSRVIHDVKQNWYLLMPEVARSPIMKRGKLTIEFAITKDGEIGGMKLIFSSGDVALDRAAWGSITNSHPFPPLPTDFKGDYLGLRFRYYYNYEENELD